MLTKAGSTATGSHRRPRGASITETRAASVVEAVALGHDELRTEHLLLGVRAVGGPGAHALAAAGIGLSDLRRAVSGSGAGAVTVVKAADRRETHSRPLSEPARDILDRVAFRRDDVDLLRALLDDEDAAAPVLDLIGDRVDDVRAHLAAAAPSEASSTSRPVGPAERGTVWLGAAHAQLLTAPIDRVWSLVSDPQRRAEWDPACVGVVVTAAGAERVLRPDGTTSDHLLAHAFPQRRITWRWPAEHRLTARPWTKELQIAVVAREGRTAIRLALLARGRRPMAGLLGPFVGHFARRELRLLAQGINQAAE